MVYLREINNILILLDVVYTFVHSKRRGKTMGFPAASLNVQSNCHFVTDKNTFLGREAVQWTANRKIREIAYKAISGYISAFSQGGQALRACLRKSAKV
jgi:hypothetical protein